jgi:hypothetical protein
MLHGNINLTRKEESLMEHIALFVKGLMGIGILALCFSSIYIYRVWTKDTSRRVRIGLMGFSIDLGPAVNKGDEPPVTEIKPLQKNK